MTIDLTSGGLIGRYYRDRHRPARIDELLPMLPAKDRQLGELARYVRHNVALAVFPGLAKFSGIKVAGPRGQAIVVAFYGNVYRESGTWQTTDECLVWMLDRYREAGIQFLADLDGDFQIAIYDEMQRRLVVATDHFRLHPIVYRLDPDRVTFAPSIDLLQRGEPHATWSINPQALVRMVASYVIPAPETIYQEAAKLLPGTALHIAGQESSLVSYWDVSLVPDWRLTKPEHMHRLREAFERAMKVRLDHEAPSAEPGTYLSGGLDSSTVTGVMHRVVGRPIKAFSIGFAEERYDELYYARIAARHFQAQHMVHHVTPQETVASLERLASCFDEPFGNSSAIAAYACAQLARKHGVSVLYAGDGGDELFAGNKRYAKQKLYDYYHRVPAALRTHVIEPWLVPVWRRLPLPALQKLVRYIDHARVPYPERLSAHSIYEFFPEHMLFHPDMLATLPRDFHPDAMLFRWYATPLEGTPLDRQLYADLKITLSDNDLVKVKRTAEAAGIDVRFPFLDRRLVEQAMAVPASWKLPGLRLRGFYKEMYRDFLPREVLTKSKHGFGLPMPVWLKAFPPLREWLHELLLSPRALQRGYFQRHTLEALIQRHEQESTGFFGTTLWNIMAVELWHRVRGH
ncbi:MAG: hypothetical protein D6690_01560 [Nitrospirae bacterium]|nr:MAG: hypothetical protein D6690_01560 [Nitrospirota bacterium]